MKETIHLEVDEGSIDAAKMMAIMNGKRSYRSMLSEELQRILEPYMQEVVNMQEKQYTREEKLYTVLPKGEKN